MGVPFAIGYSLFSVSSSRKALEQQARMNAEQSKRLIFQMNHTFQNLEQERNDAFDSTVNELVNLNRVGSRLQASVITAVNERMGGTGRTAQALKRATNNELNIQRLQLLDNYRRKSNEIDLNKENALYSTQQSTSQIKQVKKPSLFQTMFELGTGFMEGMTIGKGLSNIGGKGNNLFGKSPTKSSPFSMNTTAWDRTVGHATPLLGQTPSFFNTSFMPYRSFTFKATNPYMRTFF